LFLKRRLSAGRDLRLIAAAGADEVRDLRVSRVRTIRHAGDRRRVQVVAGRRVVEQVRIDRARVVVLVEVRQVRFEAGHGVDLLLEADAALPRVRVLVVGADDARRLRRRRGLRLVERRDAARRIGDERRAVGAVPLAGGRNAAVTIWL
jgi:hypothetical protein